MTNQIKFKITPRQYMFILIGSAIGSGIFSLPREAGSEALQDGWIAVLMGVFSALLSLVLIVKVCKKYPDLTIYEITERLAGKWMAIIFTIGFVIYTFFIAALSIRIFSEITSLFLLTHTPVIVIMSIYMLFVVYAIKGGAQYIGRFNEFIFIFLILSILLMLPSLSEGYYTNIFPIGEAGAKKILKAFMKTAFSYASVEVTFVYYSMVTEKDKILKYGTAAMCITAFIYTLVTAICIVVFGASMLQKIIWPPILLYKIVDVPIIERLDLLFLLLWIALAVRPAINFSFASAYSILQILGLKENRFPLVCIISGVCIFFIAIIPQNINQVFRIATYSGYGFFVIGIGYPIILLTVSIFKREVRAIEKK